MAPSGRTKTKPRRRKPRVTHFKKQNPQSKNQEMSSNGVPTNRSSKFSNEFSNMGEIDSEVIEVSTGGCTTPKAERFRIPEISTCPPAPKKPRVLPNCSLHRTPISFFAPPDLELFFFVALRDISV